MFNSVQPDSTQILKIKHAYSAVLNAKIVKSDIPINVLAVFNNSIFKEQIRTSIIQNAIYQLQYAIVLM